MKITTFEIELNKKEVLRSMQCYEDSPLYEELAEEYEKWIPKVHASIEACALVSFGTIPKETALGGNYATKDAFFVLLTVGNQVSRLYEEEFRKEDYLAGLLIDTIADCYLFKMEKALEPYIRQQCRKRNVGIAKRVDAPNDIPFGFQKVVYDKTDAVNEEIKINESYMLEPLKSMTYALILSENQNEFHAEHDCRNCSAKECKMRRIQGVRLTVIKGEKQWNLTCCLGESILDAMRREALDVSSLCGGRGTCGKCKVKLLEGQLVPCESDRQCLTSKELEEGIRLACKAYPKEDCCISLDMVSESEYTVLSEFQLRSTEKLQTSSDFPDKASNEKFYVIGIDIGTTTLAMQLLDGESGQVIETYTALNRQRRFGADVISRMDYSNQGNGEQLQQSIRQDITKGVEHFQKTDLIRKIVIAGNTTMIHLLLGLSCKTLGIFPFEPVTLERITGHGELLGMNQLQAEVIIYSGISTFVGGDITAGLMACGFHKTDKINLLVDLGTNGEMAIGNADKILCTSTAAGPAFEGGNLSCGVGSIPGAVCGVTINSESDTAVLQTIADKEPIGICGTGIVEAIAELVKIEAIDETGRFEDAYFEDGYLLYAGNDDRQIIITQKDIREFQLAKAATRAGIEILCRRFDITYDKINNVYLAGGFGYAMNVEKAVRIGLFPEELQEKIVPVGNASLQGTLMELRNECTGEDELACIATADEISLSADSEFNDLYMDYMYFE